MTKLKVFSLEGCYYSQSAEELLNKNNIDFCLERVKQNDKQKIKDKNNMNTFPQVFLETSNNNIQIGGFTELNNIYEIVNKKKDYNKTIKQVSENLNLSCDDEKNKKTVLRLVNILVNK